MPYRTSGYRKKISLVVNSFTEFLPNIKVIDKGERIVVAITVDFMFSQIDLFKTNEIIVPIKIPP